MAYNKGTYIDEIAVQLQFFVPPPSIYKILFFFKQNHVLFSFPHMG